MMQLVFGNNHSQAYVSAQEHKAHKRLLRSKSQVNNSQPRQFEHIKHGTKNAFNYKQKQEEVYVVNQILKNKIDGINRAVTPLNPFRMK